jgi:thiol-disulfide isomerase/thioredoxin
MHTRPLLTRIAAAFGCVVLVLCAGCSTTGSRSASNGLSAGGVTIVPASARKAAPDLSGELVGGGRADLSSSDGRIVVLNVWASWCVPCRTEAAGLVEAAHALSNVSFFGIDIRDSEGQAEAFIRTHQVPYPSFADQDSSLLLELQRVVPVPGQPVTIILDKHHRVAASIYGSTTAITLKDIIRPLERET